MTKLFVLNNDLPRRQILMSAGAGTLFVACGGAMNNATSTGDMTADGAVGSDAGQSPTDGGNAVDAGMACTPLSLVLGAVTDFPPTTWTMFSSHRLIVGHDDGGLFAYSNICLHQGCLVRLTDPTTGDAYCPCHGSEFDGNGGIVRGPVRVPMDHYALDVCDGMVTVDRSMVVDPSTRVAV